MVVKANIIIKFTVFFKKKVDTKMYKKPDIDEFTFRLKKQGNTLKYSIINKTFKKGLRLKY